MTPEEQADENRRALLGQREERLEPIIKKRREAQMRGQASAKRELFNNWKAIFRR